MLADYAVTFVPWISYLVLLQAAGSWRFGFLAGVAVAAGVVIWRTIRHEGRFFDTGTLVYCSIMALVSNADPNASLKAYNVPLSLTAIGALSGVSLLARAPFTYRIARAHVDDDMLANDAVRTRFYESHVKATASWTIVPGIAAAAAAVLIGTQNGSAAVVVQTVGILVPVGATRHWHGLFLSAAAIGAQRPAAG